MAYTSLLDMLDGGGAGRSGSTFQGGGILSSLANAFAKPIGSQRRTSNNLSNMINQLQSGTMSDGSIRQDDFSGLQREEIPISELILDDISFEEFETFAKPIFIERGIEPSFDIMMKAYVNYLNRP
ncbi:hypothetical protein [uncultured Mediterranean phage uvMED]|nr:hypothetical protein [uncultured Mediterranean phage uvMED]BAR19736.1 hypothetical protein [uncultured Mediterranean phage uvMED]BAR19829.1 hypothetical protein [uncultured Mediterranean phage uvMED]